MKYDNDTLWKVYSDDPETECWAEEYLNEIIQSSEYKQYEEYIDLQIEKQIEEQIEKQQTETTPTGITDLV